jgi:hypothetical protein
MALYHAAWQVDLYYDFLAGLFLGMTSRQSGATSWLLAQRSHDRLPARLSDLSLLKWGKMGVSYLTQVKSK